MALRTFNWNVSAGLTVSNNLKVNVTTFGDYEQLSTTGINNSKKSIPLSMTDYLSVIAEAELFLREHQGVIPFRIIIDEIAGIYRTVGTIDKTHVGHKVWTLSFNVVQVFLPDEEI